MAECADIQEKNSQLKSQLRELEKKKEIQLQNQATEANEQKEALNQQVVDLACQAKEQSMRISSLEKIVSEKELDLLRLRDVISSLKAEKEAQALAVETLKEEQTKRLLELQLQHQQDKDMQLSLLKEELQCQKQKEIQQFAENMEQVKTKALQDQAESLKKEMDKVLKTLVLKDKEIGKLKENTEIAKGIMKKTCCRN
ncbi:A-kinase anchor protein 9-like [Bombina bombina]|uniref:A-kinase anchor protein 9-like n=1 Tax=Bombina bombina TaxID=8345 RepID=UPI00235ADEE8|nr:A-kinase anchor protein 9-like [Bombina bombina]